MKQVQITSRGIPSKPRSQYRTGGTTTTIMGGGGTDVDLSAYMLLSRWLENFEERTDASGTPYLYAKKSIVSVGGITVYATEDVVAPSIFDGIPLDNKTIWKNPTTGKIEVIGGSGGSFDDSAMWAALAGSTTEQINKSHLTTALTGYATESWVSGKNYAVKATTLDGYGITDAYTKTESDNKYPTKTGSGASGTWGISISGNAATANNADTLDNVHLSGIVHSDQGYSTATTDAKGTSQSLSRSGFWRDNNRARIGIFACHSQDAKYGWELSCGYNSVRPYFSVKSAGSWMPQKTIAFLDDNVASASKLNSPQKIWGQPFDGTNSITGNLDLGSQDIIGYGGARIIQNLGANMGINPSGYVGIGTTSPSYKLHVIGGIYASGEIRGARYILEDNTLTGLESSELFTSNRSSIRYSSDGIYVNGGTFRPIIRWGDIVNGGGYHTRYVFGSARDEANDWGHIFMAVSNNDAGTSTGCSFSIYGGGYVEIVGNLLVTGGVTLYGSDIRYKSIMQQVKLSLSEIAKAPSFVYHWNKEGMKCDRLNLGGSAQYTQTILPWAVEEKDNFLSMDYATVAYTFAVHTARHLLSYETRTDKEIKKLKKKVLYLENQLKKLGYEEANIVDD